MTEARAIRRARDLLAAGDSAAAVDVLCGFLGEVPDDGAAHAVLAVALHAQGRMQAALHEAGLALSLAPGAPEPHVARAVVGLGIEDTLAARHHAREALALDPTTMPALLVLAEALGAEGIRDEQRRVLEQALALDPQNSEAHVGLADLALAEGQMAKALDHAEHALALDPVAPHAHAAAGRAALAAGRLEDAQRHARMALTAQPRFLPAIDLLTACRMRRNPVMGLWWRWNAWVARKGDHVAVAILLSLYLTYRVLVQISDDAGLPLIALAAAVLWIGVAGLTWLGPSLFMAAITREVAPVRMRKDV